MKPDLLYTIFEQHLFNALVENESADEFLARVVRDYMGLLQARGSVPKEHVASIEADLREEVLEMLRKKTYGHFNLSEFRQTMKETKKPTNDEDDDSSGGKRSRRPC